MEKVVKLGVILCLSFLLVACQKPQPAKEAVTVLVNGLIYNKEPEKINQLYTYKDQYVEKEGDNQVSELQRMLNLDESYDQQLGIVLAMQQQKLVDKTSFKVNILKEGKGKTEVEVSVLGLEAIEEGQLTESLESELEKKLGQLSAETTEQEIAQLVDEISVSTLAKLTEEQTTAKNPTVLILKLMTDSTDKKKWVIQNEETFVRKLVEAFGQKIE